MSEPAQTAHAEAQFDHLLTGLLQQIPAGMPYPQFTDSLGQRDRHLLLIQGLDSQVANGGFAQWIENGYLTSDLSGLWLALDRLTGTLEGDRLRTVQLVETLLEEVAAVAAGANPDGLDECDLDRLDPLDDRYYALYGEFRAIFWQYFLTWGGA